MSISLYDYQSKAIDQMHNGSILCGGVGSGKSLTALFYYYEKECGGKVREEMKNPRDLYIITTAKKRDSLEWHKECYKCSLVSDPNDSVNHIKFTVDSWNNIKKYKNVYGAFFIFDEQRVVGSGEWVKVFLDITRKNHWILLSATPGDQWSDYIPVFVANGFYKNKTEFQSKHCVFSRFAKYPKIEKYVGEKELRSKLNMIMVRMRDPRETVRHNEQVIVEYDPDLYRLVMKNRWDPYDDCPIEETGKLCYLLRRVANSHEDRLDQMFNILWNKKNAIIFYNFDYELEMITKRLSSMFYDYAQWNGHKHEEIPLWAGTCWAYLVQYTAGCEGWNCIETDTVIFFSQNYSYRITEQASGRIDRINTKFKDLYYYHLRSDAPIDRAIRLALKNKRNFNERNFLK